MLDNNYSLNTVDICPVGALTSTDFRFKMRVWFLQGNQDDRRELRHRRNITIGARENVIYRITPRENNDVNGVWLPDSHRLNFKYVGDEAPSDAAGNPSAGRRDEVRLDAGHRHRRGDR